MAPKGWAAGTTRKEWLTSRLDDFISARKNNTTDLFYSNVFKAWFALYHWSLPDNIEPAPGAAYTEPDPDNTDACSEKEEKIGKKKRARIFFFSLPVVLSPTVSTSLSYPTATHFVV